MKRAVFAKQRVEIFKPAIDTRYSDEDVVSHDRNAIHCTPVNSSSAILLLSADIDVVGIDEAQFMDEGLVDVCNELANRGVRVIVAGFQGWCLNSTLKLPVFAMAFIKSTSKPSTLPAESNDSKGANSALAAMRYTLSALGADEEASLF